MQQAPGRAEISPAKALALRIYIPQGYVAHPPYYDTHDARKTAGPMGRQQPDPEEDFSNFTTVVCRRWGAVLPFNAKEIRRRKVKEALGPIDPLCASRSTSQMKRGAGILGRSPIWRPDIPHFTRTPHYPAYFPYRYRRHIQRGREGGKHGYSSPCAIYRDV